jgi:hypothetical protein
MSTSGRWLFIVNSANTPANLTVAGWPEDSEAEDAFDGKPLALNAGVPLWVDLRAYGVAAFGFNKGAAQAK